MIHPFFVGLVAKTPFTHHFSGQIIATSAEVTPNGGLVRESPQNPLNSGLEDYSNLPRFLLLRLLFHQAKSMWFTSSP